MLKSLRSPATLLALLVAVSGALLVLYAWKLPPFGSAVETTENAYVKGQVTIISPQLAGYVKTVAVQDYQSVKAGDLIVEIDDRIYDQKVKQAQAVLAGQKANLANADQSISAAKARIGSSQAQIASAQAALRTAEANADRVSSLLEKGISTQATGDQATQALDQARAGLRQAEAALEVSRQDLQSIVVNRQSLEASVENAKAAVQLAVIDLQNTRVLAPQDGRLGEIGVRLGQYVAAGTQLASLVPARKWVVANFKETQLYGMKIGQPVSFTVDALRHQTLTGRIQEFSPATGAEFSVLKADNATGNFTKIAQRLPVRIAIDEGQPLAADLAPGMSVVVTIDTGAAARP
ncbi:HlyD family secretion protein [Bosea lathyri]|jgi:multidrug resistance efflux pump|uniref:Multidrug resistance efflux pump n=1 Tax=Bosea lathyri TaxID=1036778 RepID=A0A1H6D8H0_9HYPH|nr:HlyD family secretion protein [Bosea lathyri]SEG81549.1 Multidrug resistance efflux pump [Bosea lathyri]